MAVQSEAVSSRSGVSGLDPLEFDANLIQGPGWPAPDVPSYIGDGRGNPHNPAHEGRGVVETTRDDGTVSGTSIKRATLATPRMRGEALPSVLPSSSSSAFGSQGRTVLPSNAI